MWVGIRYSCNQRFEAIRSHCRECVAGGETRGDVTITKLRDQIRCMHPISLPALKCVYQPLRIKPTFAEKSLPENVLLR
jgi:hypothetical protein